jgi:HD-GYP domain-containing protein (c-di-GMP phosphodiesterase class II)
MQEKIRIKQGDIIVGQKLPWPVYDVEEALLLQESTLIASVKQLNVLLEKGLYRGLTTEEAQENKELKKRQDAAEKRKKVTDNPFDMKNSCAKKTEQLLGDLASGIKTDVVEITLHISNQIRHCCQRNANATLAAVHLSEEFSYSVLHPLHTTILCELLMRRLNFTDTQKQTVMSASLTMNVGMYELQNQLFSQAEPLTDAQKKAINEHPEKSVSILKAAGIDDSHWLAMISQHHERIDGKGYPLSLDGQNIHQGAKVIALADMYSAMITSRSYRKPIEAHKALKDIFTKRGKFVDDKLTQLLIREVGIYPPGSFVKLINGDTAIVIKRAISKKGGTTAPSVCSIISPRGGFYERLSTRDSGLDMYKITGMCQPTIDEAIDYPKLWGYS